jgi:hypothetical protein
MISILVINTCTLMTRRISRSSMKALIKTSIAFGFSFYDHDLVTGLIFKQQTIKMTF